MSLRHTRKLRATNRLLAYCKKTGERRNNFMWADEPEGINNGAIFMIDEVSDISKETMEWLETRLTK